MGPPTVTQRVDTLEEKVLDLDETLKEMVSQTVDKAMDAMRHSLTEVLLEGQSLAVKKMGAEFEALTGRLEGRVNRSREHHETLINTMRNDQLKFQADVRSTLEKLDASAHRSDPLVSPLNSA